ncbi:hypothetical protein [Mycobacterium sp. 29Ha]|uniref:hypothetical protein n=1 Tax=Mycobacterium sp. 29Ha TaxID=2939268 RepID=UPI0029391C4B|nr:hypothetical protein [Mycobacterium sp. 29Ha]MDV3133337.1 hypothetical protein [Mycobacterium sp. 29Ha]
MIITDRRLRRFFAVRGYPDPATISQERTIWPAGATVRTSRICSASSMGKVAVTSPEIRQIVADIYTHHLELPPEWPSTRRQEFIEVEAARISRQVAEVAAQMGERAIADWKASRGDHPDYMTKVGLLNTAATSAKEMVLSQELYELIPEPPEEETLEHSEPIPDRSQVPWDQRWIRSYWRSDPSEELEDLAARVWPDPDFSDVFRIKAGYLLAALAEDQLPLPSDPVDPLAAQLAQLVYSDLRRDGLPER